MHICEGSGLEGDGRRDWEAREHFLWVLCCFFSLDIIIRNINIIIFLLLLLITLEIKALDINVLVVIVGVLFGICKL